jgi:ABC-2 type transport system permease protein
MREVQRALDAGRVKAAVIVMPNYARDLAAGRSAQIGLLLDGTDATTARIAASYLENMLAEQNRRLVQQRLAARGRRLPLPPIALVPSIRYNPNLRSRDFMVPGVVGLIILTLTLSLSTVAIVREREMGTLERLVMAPIAPGELIVGKMLPYLAVALFESGVALAIAHLWFGVPIRGSLAFLYATVVLFAINTLGLGLLMSSLARTQQQAVLTNVFVIMPSMLMSGFVAPISNMPVIVQYLTYAIPLRYFLQIVRGVMLKGLTPAEVWPQVLALAALTVVAMVAGAAMLRRRL